jgi:putative oxidoreductase
VLIALCAEVFIATTLILGWHVRFAAWLAALYLLAAAAALVKVSKKWLWQHGGCEYALLWSLCCLAVGALA